MGKSDISSYHKRYALLFILFLVLVSVQASYDYGATITNKAIEINLVNHEREIKGLEINEICDPDCRAYGTFYLKIGDGRYAVYEHVVNNGTAQIAKVRDTVFKNVKTEEDALLLLKEAGANVSSVRPHRYQNTWTAFDGFFTFFVNDNCEIESASLAIITDRPAPSIKKPVSAANKICPPQYVAQLNETILLKPNGLNGPFVFDIWKIFLVITVGIIVVIFAVRNILIKKRHRK